MKREALERRMIALAMIGRLTDDRLDGSACVWCGSAAEPREPIHYGIAGSASLSICVMHGEEEDSEGTN